MQSVRHLHVTVYVLYRSLVALRLSVSSWQWLHQSSHVEFCQGQVVAFGERPEQPNNYRTDYCCRHCRKKSLILIDRSNRNSLFRDEFGRESLPLENDYDFVVLLDDYDMLIPIIRLTFIVPRIPR